MHKDKHVLTTAVVGLMLAPVAQAAMYSSSSAPFDLTLNTGSYSWVNNTASLSSTSTSTSGTYSYGPDVVSTTAPIVETVIPQVGVPGYVKVYTEETSRSYDQDYTQREESLDIGYVDSISGLQSSPSNYEISGTISRQTGTEPGAVLTYDLLNFELGLEVDFGAAPPPAGLDGTITFQIGDSLGNWNYAFSSEFDSALDTISLINGHSVDFTEDISFLATYSVNGLSGVDYEVANIGLNVNAAKADETLGVEYNEEFSTEENILSVVAIPALDPPAPVPVPAAAWLFLSAIFSLGVMRRNPRQAKGWAESRKTRAFQYDMLLP